MTTLSFKEKKAEFKKNRPPFGPHHVPAGTVCEVTLGIAEPQVVTVTKVRRNGPRSYLICIDEPLTTTGAQLVNVAHITRVIKRGAGSSVVDNRGDEDFRDEFFAAEAKIRTALPAKHRHNYRTNDPTSLVFAVLVDIMTSQHLLDTDKLLRMLRFRGLLQPRGCTYTGQYYVVNKVKLKRAIRQLLNKCLLNHRKDQEANDYAAMEEQYDFMDSEAESPGGQLVVIDTDGSVYDADLQSIEPVRVEA